MRMLNAFWLVSVLILVTGIGQAALTRHFNENARVSLPASTVNINRIFVKGDKITQHVAPQGTFVFDKRLSRDGSLYFKPMYLTSSFTLFFTTAQGHHFSVQITPNSGRGQTIEMIPNAVSEAQAHWERNSGYLALLQQFIHAMILGKPLQGMSAQTVEKSSVIPLSAHTQLRLLQVYSGAHVSGLVYQLNNTGNRSVRLLERRFYHTGVRAVSLSQQVVGAHRQARVYEIVSAGDV